MNNNLNLIEKIKSGRSVFAEDTKPHDVAIIGVAANYPFAKNPDELWKNLTLGVDATGDFPENRQQEMNKYRHFCGESGADQTRFFKGSYLERIDQFDYEFFGITPREAELMDPNQKMFLQTAWAALEDAGALSADIFGSMTGVVVTAESRKGLTYNNMVYEVDPEAIVMAHPGNSVSMIAGRVAYMLDLRGPALMVDTACSAALVNVHLGCQMLRNKEADLVIAGGVKIALMPRDAGVRVGIEAENGQTRTFSDDSKGTGLGEGVVAVILKPLAAAKRDGDHIYAIIKGSSVNHDGKAMSVTAPNAQAQENLLHSAWRQANIDPKTLSYIETHGTGTRLGDPIEFDAISKALRKYTDQIQVCGIGSVKSNLAHTDNIAGMSGLLKVVLSLKNQQIPPSLHFNDPNRQINFEESPLYVNDRLLPWDAPYPRRAGVSAFGMSGTICHMVIEEAPPKPATRPVSSVPWIFTLSSKTKSSLARMASEFSIQLTKSGQSAELMDICYSIQLGRQHFAERLSLVVESVEELTQKLRLFGEENGSGSIAGVKYSSYQREPSKNYFAIDAKNLLENGSREKTLREIEDAYHQGFDIDWSVLYADHQPVKVPLPTYSFDDKYCWLKIPDQPKKSSMSPELEKAYAELVDLVSKKGESFGLSLEKVSEFQSLLPKKVAVKRGREMVRITGRVDNQYSETETDLAYEWYRLIGCRVIDLKDDFFELGGNSLSAIQLCSRLQKSYSISLNQIMTLQKFNKMVEVLEKSKEQNAMEDGYIRYRTVVNRNQKLRIKMKPLLERRKQELSKLDEKLASLDLEKKVAVNSIFLTGSTGFLGINLVKEILDKSRANLILLVRASNKDQGMKRLQEAWDHFFANEPIDSRIRVVCGDVQKTNLGLSPDEYEAISCEVDTIFHCAGNVNHFGNWQDFYNTNVLGTKNIIELAKNGHPKMLHHISTTGIARGMMPEDDCFIFTEDHLDVSQSIGNPYGESKFQSEKNLLEARKYGLKCNIYRLGNIMFNSKTLKFQKNMGANWIYTIVKSLCETGVFPADRAKQLDFTYVDCAAESIFLIAQSQALENQNYHIFNEKRAGFNEMREAASVLFPDLESYEIVEFLRRVIDTFQKGESVEQIQMLLTHLGFFDYKNTENTMFHVDNSWTNKVLERLGFSWKYPDQKMLKGMIQNCRDLGFL